MQFPEPKKPKPKTRKTNLSRKKILVEKSLFESRKRDWAKTIKHAAYLWAVKA